MTKILHGVAASPGIVIGLAYHVQRTKTEVVYQQVINQVQVVVEQTRLNDAVAQTTAELNQARDRIETELPTQIYLIDAHLLMLHDPAFHQKAERLIEEQMINAEWAVIQAVNDIAEQFATIDDPYIQSRVEDVRAVGDRVLRILAGRHDQDLFANKGVIIAQDLSPADAAHLTKDRVMGLVTTMGSRTSHTAIVARALEIPAVVGLENALELIKAGGVIIVDGTSGQVIIDPDEATLVDFQERLIRYEDQLAIVERTASEPAITVDRRPVTVLANIEQPEESEAAVQHGAEGVGLLRTEFLYLNQTAIPDEEQLYQAYRRTVEAMSGRPVTIRTLDLGGDKFAHQFNLAPELNPAMGLRAVRFCLRRQDLFKTQLRAVLRASIHGPVEIMFPLISGVEELLDCRRLLAEASAELGREGIGYDRKMKIGCMIEVPSAAIVSDLLGRHVDFFSIGTNDLIQYSLAIDRGNEYVAHMYQPLHPAVLRMIRRVVTSAAKTGVEVTMCGEMAAEPRNFPLLLGLGLTRVSVNPQSVGLIKYVARMCSWEICSKLAVEALNLETQDEIDQFVSSELNRLYPDAFTPDGQLNF